MLNTLSRALSSLPAVAAGTKRRSSVGLCPVRQSVRQTPLVRHCAREVAVVRNVFLCFAAAAAASLPPRRLAASMADLQSFFAKKDKKKKSKKAETFTPDDLMKKIEQVGGDHLYSLYARSHDQPTCRFHPAIS